MKKPIALHSLEELITAFQTKALSPLEVTREALARITNYNPSLNAFCHVTEELALNAARESEARWGRGQPLGPLDGVPMTVKDTLMVKGQPFRRGSRATSGDPVGESAPVVDHALNAGAVLLGVTTTPEFGAGPVTISPLTGITRNPWDTSRTSGGSSGGAAAALAAGIGHAALATDAGGSIRIPAALCGVVGFKSTGGRVPTYPPNVAGTLSSPGALTRSVRDAAYMLDLLARPDLRDPEMLPPASGSFLEKLSKPLPRCRIAFTTDMGYAQRVDPEVAQAVRRAAAQFSALGFEVEEADPGVSYPLETFLSLFRPGFAYTLRNMSEAQLEQIGPALQEVVSKGREVSVLSYLAAQDQRRSLARQLQHFHARYPLLLTPSVSVPAFKAELWTPFSDLEDMRAWTPFLSLFNLTQQPAISLPCGLHSQGLPIGLQIVGPRFADAEVLAAAALYEESTALNLRSPMLRGAASAQST